MTPESDDTELFLESLRKYLKTLRLEKKMTQVELAQKGNNQHQSAIARLESGSSPNIGIKILFEISRGFDIPLWQIVRQAENSVKITVDDQDEWQSITKNVLLLPPLKKKKFEKIVQEMLQQLTDA